jgi:ABC-type amino acid transport substrate-binding protein
MSRFGAALLLAALACLWGEAASAAEDHLESVRRSGELRVCIWPEYFAISYRDPRTGTLSGIDIDLARALAADLGVTPRFVDSSFARLEADMTNDACDITMHAVGVRPDRARSMAFSDPYLVSGIYAIGSKANPTLATWDDVDRPDHVVVVQKGTYMEPVMRETLHAAKLEVVDDFKAREREVESGRADVFMTDYPYGQRMLTMTSWARLIEPPQPMAPTPYAYAVPLGDAVWLARVNAFVRAIKADGRLRRAAAAHGLLPIVTP